MTINDKKEVVEGSVKIKVFVRKNLKMTTNKTAAQVAHAVLGLGVDKHDIVVVLDISDKKFLELVYKLHEDGVNYHVVTDAGYTEVPPGTKTCVAFVENI